MEHLLPDSYSPEEQAEILRRYERLLSVWQTRKEPQDLAAVEDAFYFAANAHQAQRRRTGEPYIYHPIAVATIAAEDIGLGRTSLVCALLHDVVEDTEYTLDDIRQRYGDKVAVVIDGLTKLDKVENAESLQAENFKKIISTLSQDVRVVLVKLADRLHNMRTLGSMPPHKQLKIASETSYIYAPLAYRLGLHAIKNELEDLSLKYRDPVIYESIQKQMNEVRAEKTAQLEQFLVPIKEAFLKRGVNVEAQIIERSTYSIWKRMQKKQLTFDDLYGNFNIRMITDCPRDMEKIECWKIYAIITDVYTPNASKLRDWISNPKINGYESIHGLFMGKDGNWVEVQIRTKRMNEIAEKGFTAYWLYRPENQSESGLEEWMKRVNELLNSDDSTIDFVDTFTNDLFSDEIKVFTPQGKAITLPKHSTALDFAYTIHSEVGNHSIAAHVNNHLVQLDHKLKTGDQVEIITSEAQHPQEKWFEFLNTAFAKSKLKTGIKEYRRGFREKGEEIFNNIMRKLGLEASKANRSKVMEDQRLTSAVDFFYYLSQGRINEQTISKVLKPQSNSGGSGFFRYLTFGLWGNDNKQEETPIDTSGEFDFNVASCCNPIPGDEVVAFNFPGEPLQIHRSDCPKAINMMSHYGNNIVKAKWQPKSEIAFLAAVKFTAIDHVGLLNKITDLLSNEMKLNLHSLQMESKQDLVEATLSVYVHSTVELNTLINKLNQIKEVRKAARLI